jgi:tetratricopeptide (TPR) repeat protein
VHAHTDGLPLFVVNVLDDLLSQGELQADAIRLGDRTAIGGSPVPESLMGVIEKHIARLSAELQALLGAASVCGVEFRPGIVAQALERDAAWVGERCDELVRQQRWLSPPALHRLPDGTLDARYAFRHALYRHVFYQRLGGLMRAQLHHRVASAMVSSRAQGSAVTAAELASHYELSHDFATALPHYAAAAESALRHFAPAEATALTERGLELLPRLPAGRMRDALELTLAGMKGVAAAQLRGVSSLEAKHAFERAHALLDVLPEHPLRSMVLHALGLVLLVRGEYIESRSLGERIHALSDSAGDRTLLLCACSLLGQIHALEGSHREARSWLERGIATCDELGDDSLQAAFVVDPGVTMHAALAIPLLHLGLADQARARIAAARARARKLGQPMGQMVAIWFNALLEVRMQSAEVVATLAAELAQVVENGALAQGKGPSMWYRGWAQARLGAPDAGHRLIREAYEHNTRLGMFSGTPEVLGYAAEALLLAGDLSQAEDVLREGMRYAGQLRQRVYVTQMLMLGGRIALARGQAAAAREAMLAALSEAREQQSPWLELTVRVALCKLGGRTAQDLEALRDTYSRFDEGFELPVMVEARQLLAEPTPAAARR